MKQMLMTALLLTVGLSAQALKPTEEGQALKACGTRSHFLLGTVYVAGEYGNSVIVMEFKTDVDSKTVTDSLKESGMSDKVASEIAAALPAEIRERDVVRFILRENATSVSLNNSGSKDVSKIAYAGVLTGIKAKIGSGWKQPCK